MLIIFWEKGNVAPLDLAARKVFHNKIFVKDYSKLLFLLNMVKLMCEMLLTIMTPVVQVRDVPDPTNKKCLG